MYLLYLIYMIFIPEIILNYCAQLQINKSENWFDIIAVKMFN